MNCWFFLVIFALLLASLTAISMDNRQSYRLGKGETSTHTVQLQQMTRYTFAQTEGRAELMVATAEGETIANHQQSLAEGSLSKDTLGAALTFTISALTAPAAGFLQISPARTHEELRAGGEKLIHLRKGETRVVEIRARESGKLTIERFDGVPLFINNRCQNYERKECLDEMHRFTAAALRKHVEVVPLEACANCILLVKITTASPHARLRMSIHTNRTTLTDYPTLAIITKDQVQRIFVSGEPGQTGRVTVYSGAVQLESRDMDFERLDNAFTYTIREGREGAVMMELTGAAAMNYVMVQNPADSSHIALLDGLPVAHFLEPAANYSLTYENANEGRSNIVLSGPSELLERLSVKFTDTHSQEHYLIRPKFLFHTPTASQSFQLVPHAGAVLIELHLVSGPAGSINVTSEVNEHISLPLDYSFSSILKYNEYDDYVVEGLAGIIDLEIKKCVDCVLKYAISEEPIVNLPTQALQNLSTVESRTLKGSQLYVRVHTTNYAYYSIQARKHSPANQSSPRLPDQQIRFYLTEDAENNLLMEFQPPQCGPSQCSHVKYYLLEGSDMMHLTSKVYCPSSLFDFDERTKDIVFEQISPRREGEQVSYSRPLKHRDFIGIVAEVEGAVLGYRVVNTAEVKLYKEMRWPFFYLCLFVTASLFCAFMIFMALRRKSRENGYVRASGAGSLESFS